MFLVTSHSTGISSALLGGGGTTTKHIDTAGNAYPSAQIMLLNEAKTELHTKQDTGSSGHSPLITVA